jgi:hypothetical protein
LLIKQGVFADLAEDFIHRHGFADKFYGLGWARVRAAAAVAAIGGRPLQSAFKFLDSAIGTGRQAFPTANAAFTAIEAVGGLAQALGIVAPPARQGTALKKNGRPNAGTIVDGKLFYVKYFSGYSGCHQWVPFARFSNGKKSNANSFEIITCMSTAIS